MICLNCGKEFTGHKRKFCNPKCNIKYKHLKRSFKNLHGPVIPRSIRYPKKHKKPDFIAICPCCGKTIKGRVRIYCNRACMTKYRRRLRSGDDISVYVAPKQFKPATVAVCPICFSRFKVKSWRKCELGVSKKKRFCSKACSGARRTLIASEVNALRRIKSNHDRSLLESQILHDSHVTVRREYLDFSHAKCLRFNCYNCGQTLDFNTVDCSKKKCKDCKKKTLSNIRKSADRATRRRRKDKGRAEYYGVEYEPISRLKVFNKYKWKCAQCGVDTPKDKRGSYDDDAPELDHVIPISRGGPHLYANVQLLCRACNGAKSNTIIDGRGQYGLKLA